MKKEKVLVQDVTHFENNYKNKDAVMLHKLKNSIEKYGQLRPINCFESNGDLLCFEGKNILKAITELGLKEVEINNHGDITSLDASKTIKDITQLHFLMNDVHFKKCDVKVSEMLNVIENVNYSLLPFDKEEVDSFIALLKFDWLTYSRAEAKTQHDLFAIQEEVKEVELFCEVVNEYNENKTEEEKQDDVNATQIITSIATQNEPIKPNEK